MTVVPGSSEAMGQAQEVPVEAVAERLGLPVAMLVRRIDAGDLPGRRVEGRDGVEYRVVLGPAVASAVAEIAPPADPPPPPAEPRDAPPAPAVPARVAPAPVSADAEPSARAGEDHAHAEAAMPVGEVGSVEVDRHGKTAGAAGGSLAPRPERRGPGAVVTEDLSRLGIDARELVAALLERWERTYEARVHAEFRLRYGVALSEARDRVHLVESELAVARSELASAHAARESDCLTNRAELSRRDRDLAALREQLQARLSAILERDRLLAEREGAITARDRLLAELRGEQAEREAAVAAAAAVTSSPPARRRGWFRRGR